MSLAFRCALAVLLTLCRHKPTTDMFSNFECVTIILLQSEHPPPRKGRPSPKPRLWPRILKSSCWKWTVEMRWRKRRNGRKIGEDGRKRGEDGRQTGRCGLNNLGRSVICSGTCIKGCRTISLFCGMRCRHHLLQPHTHHNNTAPRIISVHLCPVVIPILRRHVCPTSTPRTHMLRPHSCYSLSRIVTLCNLHLKKTKTVF